MTIHYFMYIFVFMTGKELFNKYTNEANEYAQTLMTIWAHIGDAIFPLLEKADKDGKKLDVKAVAAGSEYLQDELTTDDIILV